MILIILAVVALVVVGILFARKNKNGIENVIDRANRIKDDLSK